MTATVKVPVFRDGPRRVTAALAGGGTTQSRSAPLVVSTSDFGQGFNNVTEMKVWGDLDAGFYPELHGANEGASRWFKFSRLSHMVLSTGTGTKTLNVKVRNASQAESDVVTTSCTFSSTIPHPSILWADIGRAPSVVDGKVRFAWSSSHAYSAASLCYATNLQAAYEDCTVELVSYPAGNAGDTNWVDLDVAADLLPVDPQATQSGHKLLKVFVQVAGIWYGAINGV
jgi:hypothetical protein